MGSLLYLLSCSYTDWAQNRTWCFIHVLSLSPVFGLKFKVLLSYCVLVTEKKVWKFIWNYFLFTTWMINKLDHLEISIVKSKQNFGWSKRGFLPQIFVSWWKLKWQITLCSNKMLLKRPQTSNQIFSRTLDERLLEQKQKFAIFSLHYFCIMLLLAVLLALRAE